jgi:hypothetical protein
MRNRRIFENFWEHVRAHKQILRFARVCVSLSAGEVLPQKYRGFYPKPDGVPIISTTFVPLPECGQNQTAVSNTQQSLSYF